MLFGLFGRGHRGTRSTMMSPNRRALEMLLAEARAFAARRHFAAAEACFDRLVDSCPDDAQIRNELGVTRYAQGDFDGAEAAFRGALALAPQFPSALSNLGQSLQARSRFEEAMPLFEAALAIEPGNRDARFNLAVASFSIGNRARAAELCERLVAVDPDDAAAHVALGECQLGLGRFTDGWREYEWRRKVPEYLHMFRHYSQPEWDGADHPGARVLVWPEQGYGDTLQFMRLALLAARRHPAMHLILEVPPALFRLVRLSCDVCANLTVVASDGPLPPFTHHASIMGLPYLFDADLGADPWPGPYLRVDPAAVAKWAPRVAAAAGAACKVGLVWSGNRRENLGASEQAVDARRSMGANLMAGILDVRGCVFFSLQVGVRSADMAKVGADIVDLTGELTDFADTAALLANLDLVITVDTSVAHLAGALGSRVWMLSRFDCCWRWGARAPNIAWYPALRPFYQPAPGAWEPVAAEVRASLEQFVAARGA